MYTDKLANYKSSAKQKTYATRTTLNNACPIPKTYDFVINDFCLKCEFCINKAENKNKKIYQSSNIEIEEGFSKELYLTPLVISKYSEPFQNKGMIDHCLTVANRFLKNNSQVIFRTSLPEAISKKKYNFDRIQNFLIQNKNNIQLQIKTCFGSSEISNLNRAFICKNRNNIDNQIDLIKKFEVEDIVCFIDPIIIGLNSNDIVDIIKTYQDNNINKVIFKQLFSTEYFKYYLNRLIDGKFIKILSEKVGKLYTYRNDILLHHLYKGIEYCENNNITYSFCMNRELNEIIGLKYNNCCLLDNPIGIYNIDRNLMNRRYGNDSIIRFNNE